MSEVLYERSGRVARITINRPDQLNAITPTMPGAIREAVERANADDEVRVLLLSGAGRAFCSGYDLAIFAETPRPTLGSQAMPWDPMIDYALMSRFTQDIMSLWRSLKPVICKVHGHAVAGVPKNQLLMQKLMVNQAYENMGLATTQLLATLFDGIARHTPEGVAWKARCEAIGFRRAVTERDQDPSDG